MRISTILYYLLPAAAALRSETEAVAVVAVAVGGNTFGSLFRVRRGVGSRGGQTCRWIGSTYRKPESCMHVGAEKSCTVENKHSPKIVHQTTALGSELYVPAKIGLKPL